MAEKVCVCTWESEKRKTVCRFSAPALMSTPLRSSWNSFTPYPRCTTQHKAKKTLDQKRLIDMMGLRA
jgi:hypothetical protein